MKSQERIQQTNIYITGAQSSIKWTCGVFTGKYYKNLAQGCRGGGGWRDSSVTNTDAHLTWEIEMSVMFVIYINLIMLKY